MLKSIGMSFPSIVIDIFGTHELVKELYHKWDKMTLNQSYFSPLYQEIDFWQ